MRLWQKNPAWDEMGWIASRPVLGGTVIDDLNLYHIEVHLSAVLYIGTKEHIDQFVNGKVAEWWKIVETQPHAAITG